MDTNADLIQPEVLRRTLCLRIDSRADFIRRQDLLASIATVLQDNGAVEVLGPLSQGNQWAVTLVNNAFAQKLLDIKVFKFEERNVVASKFDSNEHVVRMHWAPPFLNPEAVKKYLESRGLKVSKICDDTMKYGPYKPVKAMTRLIFLEGPIERIPHIWDVTFFGKEYPILFTMTGRMPVCLQCRQVGHVRGRCPGRGNNRAAEEREGLDRGEQARSREEDQPRHEQYRRNMGSEGGVRQDGARPETSSPFNFGNPVVPQGQRNKSKVEWPLFKSSDFPPLKKIKPLFDFNVMQRHSQNEDRSRSFKRKDSNREENEEVEERVEVGDGEIENEESTSEDEEHYGEKIDNNIRKCLLEANPELGMSMSGEEDNEEDEEEEGDDGSNEEGGSSHEEMHSIALEAPSASALKEHDRKGIKDSQLVTPGGEGSKSGGKGKGKGNLKGHRRPRGAEGVS